MGFLLERGKCARHADGFTLLETMIALGVSAVAMVAIMNILSRQTLMQSSIKSRADMQDFVSEKRLALEVARDRLTAAESEAKLWDLIRSVNFVATNSQAVKPLDTVTWNVPAKHLDEEKRKKGEQLNPTSRNDILVVEPTNPAAQPFWIPNAHNLPQLDNDTKSPTLGQLSHLPGTFVGPKVERSRWINLTPPDLQANAPNQLSRIRFTKWSIQLIPIGSTTNTGFSPAQGHNGNPLYQAKLHFEADKALTRGPANSAGGTAGLQIPGAQSMSADIDLGGQCEVDPQTGQVISQTSSSGSDGSTGSGSAPTPEARAIVVVHSQSDQEPECPKVKDGEQVWDDLLGRSGYSYMGAQIDENSVASQDLSGMGSCVMSPVFQNLPILECFREKCEFKSGEDIGYWLVNAKFNPQDRGRELRNGTSVTNMISRCRVCARINTSVVTVHSYSKEPAKCPKDHSEVLWEGYSLKSTTTNSFKAVEISQDLSGPGSCLSEFRKIPFAACSRDGKCEHNSDDDQAQWLYAPEGSGPTQDPNKTFKTPTAILDRVSRCAVCATPLKSAP